MGRILPRLIRVSAAAALAACATLAACFGRGGTHPNTADISGAWQYTEAFTDLAHSISCADTGTYQMVQNGTTFTGTYVQRGICQTPQGKVSNADEGPVSQGQLAGHTLKFVAPNCAYDGSVNADTYDRIDGHVVCELRDSTHLLSFSGSWKAIR